MKVRVDWTEAPDWAHYLVKNPRGTFVWCEQQPQIHDNCLVAGRTQVAQEFWDTPWENGIIELNVTHVCA